MRRPGNGRAQRGSASHVTYARGRAGSSFHIGLPGLVAPEHRWLLSRVQTRRWVTPVPEGWRQLFPGEVQAATTIDASTQPQSPTTRHQNQPAWVLQLGGVDERIADLIAHLLERGAAEL